MQPLFTTLNLVSATAAGSLLAAIWESAVLALCVTLCLRLLPRATATLRSVVWMAVLLVAVALHLRPLFSTTAQSGASVGTHNLHGLHVDPRWALALVTMWAVLSLVRLLTLSRSGLRLLQISRRSTVVPVDHELRGLLRHGHRHISLCTSSDIDRPCVVGFLKPRILLPPTLLETLKTPELTHIVLHEMEHIRRGDPWLNLLQKLSLALFPLNPVLLWVERRLCLERELACDDGVLRSTRARKLYATCLTNLAEHTIARRSLSLALGAWERHSELTHRVEHILHRPQVAMGRTRTALVAVTFTAALAGGATILAHSPQFISFAPRPILTAAPGQNDLQIARLRPLSTATATRSAISSRTALGDHATFVQTAFEVNTPSHPLPSHAPPNHVAAARLAQRTIHRSSTTVTPRPAFRRSFDRRLPQLTVTDFHVDRRTSRSVYTALQTDFSYAAVPWFNGWIIVQL